MTESPSPPSRHDSLPNGPGKTYNVIVMSTSASTWPALSSCLTFMNQQNTFGASTVAHVAITPEANGENSTNYIANFGDFYIRFVVLTVDPVKKSESTNILNGEIARYSPINGYILMIEINNNDSKIKQNKQNTALYELLPDNAVKNTWVINVSANTSSISSTVKVFFQSFCGSKNEFDAQNNYLNIIRETVDAKKHLNAATLPSDVAEIEDSWKMTEDKLLKFIKMLKIKTVKTAAMKMPKPVVIPRRTVRYGMENGLNGDVVVPDEPPKRPARRKVVDDKGGDQRVENGGNDQRSDFMDVSVESVAFLEPLETADIIIGLKESISDEKIPDKTDKMDQHHQTDLKTTLIHKCSPSGYAGVTVPEKTFSQVSLSIFAPLTKSQTIHVDPAAKNSASFIPPVSQESEKEQFMPISIAPTLNVLIIGSSEVDKAMLLNNLFCLRNTPYFDTLIHTDITCLVPVTINESEITVTKSSSPNSPRDYIINFGTFKIWFINTPTIADKSDNYDTEEFILDYMMKLPSLHGIVFAVDNDCEKMSFNMENLMLAMLGELPESALQNCCFIYTSALRNGFRPGKAASALLGLEKEVKRTVMSPKNQFCVDTTALKQVLMRQAGGHRGSLDKFRHCWDETAKSLASFLQYINNVDPTCPNDWNVNPVVPEPINSVNFTNRLHDSKNWMLKSNLQPVAEEHGSDGSLQELYMSLPMRL